MPSSCLAPTLVRSNSPELHLYGIIALGSWQNLPATRKRNVSPEGEQKSVQGREETCKRMRQSRTQKTVPRDKAGMIGVPGRENLLQLLGSEREGKVSFLKPLAGGGCCRHKGAVIPKPTPEKLFASIP